MRAWGMITAVLLMPLAAQANDSVADVTQSGIRLEKTDAIRMKKEELDITPSQIRVFYEFYNDSDTPLTTAVAFPMPRRGANMYDNQNGLPDFTIQAEGKVIKPQVRHTLMWQRYDQQGPVGPERYITKEIAALGLPTDTFVEEKKLTSAQRKTLVDKGYYSTSNPDEELQATYSIDSTYWWTQTFPAHKSVFVGHSYTPELGGNSIGMVSHQEVWERAIPDIANWPHGCYAREDFIDASMKEHWPDQYARNTRCVAEMKAQGLKPGNYGASYLNYVVSTGSNWKNGIEDFTLNVGGAAVILAELDGQIKAGVGTLDIHKTNFRPQKELLVEFIGVRQPAKVPPLMVLPAEILKTAP